MYLSGQKPRCGQDYTPFWRLQGESILCLFHLLEAFFIPWPHSPSSNPETSGQAYLTLFSLWLSLLPPLSTFKDPCDNVGHLGHLGHSPHHRVSSWTGIIPSAAIILLSHGRWRGHRDQELGHGCVWKDHYATYHKYHQTNIEVLGRKQEETTEVPYIWTFKLWTFKDAHVQGARTWAVSIRHEWNFSLPSNSSCWQSFSPTISHLLSSSSE